MKILMKHLPSTALGIFLLVTPVFAQAPLGPVETRYFENLLASINSSPDPFLNETYEAHITRFLGLNAQELEQIRALSVTYKRAKVQAEKKARTFATSSPSASAAAVQAIQLEAVNAELTDAVRSLATALLASVRPQVAALMHANANVAKQLQERNR
ncbi:MAG: hypothetical protein WDO18_05130 [Acidobacteriota bacterium]